ncbi:unnamed protein product [Protopolystoma xenopodis]|uniref:Uncharacterized protein n=1 Tax=Protopolystoma xenopodis TaxID=117903 RepID=A0A448X8P6_9PLAT|nr:unnamed protein product [Protopolystoma xenopodis]
MQLPAYLASISSWRSFYEAGIIASGSRNISTSNLPMNQQNICKSQEKPKLDQMQKKGDEDLHKNAQLLTPTSHPLIDSASYPCSNETRTYTATRDESLLSNSSNFRWPPPATASEVLKDNSLLSTGAHCGSLDESGTGKDGLWSEEAISAEEAISQCLIGAVQVFYRLHQHGLKLPDQVRYVIDIKTEMVCSKQ